MNRSAALIQAKHLLGRLQGGGNVSVPEKNYGAFAFSSLSEVFFSNACSLCKNDGMGDFRIFGALYSIRHGLELMLKCIVRNDLIDSTLRVLMKAGLGFEATCEKLELPKKQRPLLMKALCILRNVAQDSLPYARSRENVNSASADRALAFMREHPDLSRDHFAGVWTSAATGHDLVGLWDKAAPTIGSFAGDAREHAARTGIGVPLPLPEIEAVVFLLNRLDDRGDGFRYPSSLEGAWHLSVPSMNLEALGELASRLEDTCKVFQDIREECYGMATIGTPTPQYSGRA